MTRITYAEFYLTLGILIAIFYGFCHSDQPPYQVSLFIQLHPKGPPIHLCNGAIVQSKLILTTAACVHYLLIRDKPIIEVHPSMLTVVAGSPNAFSDPVSVKVESIIFHEKFNTTSMENDIAILRLKTSLPLATRDDIKWIILNEYSSNNKPCLANFHLRNSMDEIPDYTQTEELHIKENTECLKSSPYPEARKEDLCSSYILPSDFDCDDIDTFIPFNGDRGTGLICKSSLVGLLSSILIIDDNKENNCSDKPVNAFYTDVGSYMYWVYDFIVEEEMKAISQDNYTSSAPFSQATEAIIQLHVMEVETKSPEVQHLQRGGSRQNVGLSLQLHLAFLFLCVHFIY